jgi:hypothetical protein
MCWAILALNYLVIDMLDAGVVYSN